MDGEIAEMTFDEVLIVGTNNGSRDPPAWPQMTWNYLEWLTGGYGGKSESLLRSAKGVAAKFLPKLPRIDQERMKR